MKTRPLGTSTLAVSALGYGCMGLEPVCGPATDRQAGRLPEAILKLTNG